ncbi:MAG: indolepyruvate ferredoxin oxidoreductase subunit alpha [Chloroflexota bacterium]
MYVITINVDKCEGDGECVGTCPVEMFELKGGKAVIVGSADDCLGCESCVSVCPSSAITLQEM